MPEPSGSRTSMTTRSGSNRRACSIASATVPGLGDDLEVLAPVEQRDEALAHDLVVVDDEQAQRLRGAVGHGPLRSVPGLRRRDGTPDDDTRARPALTRDRQRARRWPTARARMLREPVVRAVGSGEAPRRIEARGRCPRCASSSSSPSSVAGPSRTRGSRRSGGRRCSAPRARSGQELRSAVAAAGPRSSAAPASRSSSRSTTACSRSSSRERARGPPTEAAPGRRSRAAARG